MIFSESHLPKKIVLFASTKILDPKMSQPGKQTITIHKLPNISRSKGNQAMKFGQEIEYYKRNTFL